MNQLSNLSNHEEINVFDRALQDYKNLSMDVDRFTATRLQMGIYGQRQEGVHMIRIKLPGGRLNSLQLNAIADMLEKYARHDVVHITTRQDIQMHYVPLEDTPVVLRYLADAGLTTREACGNTIRNVTACSLSGVCPRQHVDINQHLDGAVQHFLRNPLTQQMPRKFKISFSACESDCAQGMMHDMGIIAVHNGTCFGFKVLAGGGLGHKPHEAIVIEEFVEEKDLLLVMEAIVSLHNRYSDRVKRAKARIKFLVDKFGREGFIEKYREEFIRTKTALATQKYPKGEWSKGINDNEIPGIGAPRHLFKQKQPDLYVFPISVPMGNLTVEQLRGLAKIADTHELQEIRVTQDQNMILINVMAIQINFLRDALALLSLGEPKIGDDIVACPGTSTCRLGITSSTILGPRLDGGEHDLKIRVSGCHNGCAQPETGDIGIYGEGRRMHGKLVPHYQMYFGGNGMAHGALAIKGPSVPAARIEAALEKVKLAYSSNCEVNETFFSWTRRFGKDRLAALLESIIEVKPEELTSVLRDHGKDNDFKVLQLGGGECAGVSQVKIGSSFFEAAHERNYRNALKFQRKFEDSVKCAEEITRLIAQGVTELLGGQKYENLQEQAEELERSLPTKPQLSKQLKKLAEYFATPGNNLNDALLTEWFLELDQWTLEVAEFCLSFDAQLDLSGALPQPSGINQS
ncbi:MAG: nitrite/sulfite reductase [Nitrosospira sp.]|nr:nitrite/sulfite reductase [Nitrosospira sp.]MBI0417284.1 nitrite/sulfite reductase [Nitrosospira sp.]MBI0417997.1 nitrite/sulfite reductase [Nitrosospira sp.]